MGPGALRSPISGLSASLPENIRAGKDFLRLFGSRYSPAYYGSHRLRIEQARPRALRSQLIPGIAQRAGFQRETAAANASIKLIAQAREPLDTVLQTGSPPRRQKRPILGRGRAAVGRAVNASTNLRQRDSRMLRHFDHRDAAQHIASVAPLIAGIAPAPDQPFRLVKMERRNGNAAARRHLADAQLPRKPFGLRFASFRRHAS